MKKVSFLLVWGSVTFWKTIYASHVWAVGVHERLPEQDEEDETVDVEQTENLTKELLDIRLEMQRYQQDRKQLQ